MKVKNLVLFGFVLSALNYLSSQVRKEKEFGFEKTDLDELKNIDLDQIRHEIGDKLETMVGEFGTAVSSIVNIGSEAFDRYITETNDEKDLGIQQEEKQDVKDIIAYIQEAISSMPSKEFEAEKTCDCDEKCSEDGECDCHESKGEDSQEVEDACDCSEQCAEECTCGCHCAEEEAKEEYCACDEHCTEDCKCSCHHDGENSTEECPSHQSSEELSEEDLQEVELSSQEEEDMLRALEEILRQEEEIDSGENDEESYVNEIQKAIDHSFSAEEVVEEEIEPEQAEISFDVDGLFSDIFDSVSETAPESEITEELVSEKTKQEEDEITAYVRQLVDELASEENAEISDEIEENDSEEEVTEEVLPEKEAAESSVEEKLSEEEEIYQQINEMYPYLSRDFIIRVYELKEVIAQNYPLNEMVLVLHRVHFDRLDDLQQFVEIVSNHGYNVNVDENKMIVDLFRRYQNTDGKILSNIFEIANQAGLLHGVYEGYWIDTEKEDAF